MKARCARAVARLAFEQLANWTLKLLGDVVRRSKRPRGKERLAPAPEEAGELTFLLSEALDQQ
jgi:hypothetical protein